MNTVERVARAIGKAYAMRTWGRTAEEAECYMGERQWDLDEFGKLVTGALIHEKFWDMPVWKFWESEARAAIAAMRLMKPQIEAALRENIWADRDGDIDPGAYEDGWNAAIDAALAEQGDASRD